MNIWIDSREKPRAITKILKAFDNFGAQYVVTKLFVGDYMNLDNPRIVVDRKQNLSELCGNVTTSHDRFRRELLRAQESGIKIVILCEHGKDITCLEDVVWWKNPRGEIRKKIDGKWQTITTNAMTGRTLFKVLTTIKAKYDVEFLFCDKNETGDKILEILGRGSNG